MQSTWGRTLHFSRCCRMDEDKGNSISGLGVSHSVDSVKDESDSWKCISLRIKVTNYCQTRKNPYYISQSVNFSVFRLKWSKVKVNPCELLEDNIKAIWITQLLLTSNTIGYLNLIVIYRRWSWFWMTAGLAKTSFHLDSVLPIICWQIEQGKDAD